MAGDPEWLIPQAASRAVFRPEKMGKADLFRGETLFAGLNSFEPGQTHAAHVHHGQDKLYYVLAGSGKIGVGDEERVVNSGDAVFAPADVPHSVTNDGSERLVVLAVLAPPPPAKT